LLLGSVVQYPQIATLPEPQSNALNVTKGKFRSH
jgi:hypothetical protein